MSLVPTPKDVEDALLRAYDFLKQSKNKTASSDIGTTFTQYSDEVQKFIDKVLAKRGVITQTELDAIDEQIRQAKKKMLEDEAKKTYVKYGVGLAVVLIVVGGLWLVTKKKSEKWITSNLLKQQ